MTKGHAVTTSGPTRQLRNTPLARVLLVPVCVQLSGDSLSYSTNSFKNTFFVANSESVAVAGNQEDGLISHPGRVISFSKVQTMPSSSFPAPGPGP